MWLSLRSASSNCVSKWREAVLLLVVVVVVVVVGRRDAAFFLRARTVVLASGAVDTGLAVRGLAVALRCDIVSLSSVSVRDADVVVLPVRRRAPLPPVRRCVALSRCVPLDVLAALYITQHDQRHATIASPLLPPSPPCSPRHSFHLVARPIAPSHQYVLDVHYRSKSAIHTTKVMRIFSSYTILPLPIFFFTSNCNRKRS